MLGPDNPFGEPHSQPELRSLLLASAVVAAILAATMIWIWPATVPFLAPKPPANPWLGEARVPSTYSFTAQTVRGEVRAWAAAPDKWRIEFWDGRMEVATGTDVWRYEPHYGVYYSIPFNSAITNSDDVPRLVDGTPMIFDDEGLLSTQRVLEWVTHLGPTTPEYLMRYLMDGHHRGSWSLEEGEYLGRKVQLLHVDARKVFDRDSHEQPYTAVLTIDPEYLFLLALELTIGPRPSPVHTSYDSITAITYDLPLPDEVFVLNPPPGARNCYTSWFGVPYLNESPECH